MSAILYRTLCKGVVIPTNITAFFARRFGRLLASKPAQPRRRHPAEMDVRITACQALAHASQELVHVPDSAPDRGDANAVAALAALGFTRSQARQALAAAQNDINHATDILLEGRR